MPYAAWPARPHGCVTRTLLKLTCLVLWVAAWPGLTGHVPTYVMYAIRSMPNMRHPDPVPSFIVAEEPHRAAATLHFAALACSGLASRNTQPPSQSLRASLSASKGQPSIP